MKSVADENMSRTGQSFVRKKQLICYVLFCLFALILLSGEVDKHRTRIIDITVIIANVMTTSS